MAKLCPKLILEGTRLTGKTELAFSLNEHPRLVGPRRYRYHSPLVSAEWCGFTNTPWGRGLINFEAEETDQALATYDTWARLFEQLRYYSWIVDRFHLSTQVWQQLHRSRTLDFSWLERRLLAIGFRIVLCSRDPESFSQAREERLQVSGNPSQYDDLKQFVHEQASFDKLASASLLPVLRLDVTDGNRQRMCEDIADWLEVTGGLHADY
ncbi:MAG: hypothetical protein WBO47_06540 [Gammaproteobacteria bacterium]